MNQNKNQKNNLVWLGTIVNTHGLKGEVRVLSNTDQIEQRFKSGNIIFLEDDKKLEIDSFRIHKNFILVTFKNLNNINEVEIFKGKKIYFERDFENEDDVEFYYSDLIEYEAIDQDKKTIGTIVEYFDQGPYYSFVIKLENNKTINLPIIDEFVGEVNEKDRKILFKIKGEDFI